MLKLWNMILVALAFCLSIFGTFLTRSGVIQSIHSFAKSPLGAWFLGFICVVVIGSTVLIVARLPLLRARTKLESLISREATFLYNNLLLVALSLTILWGVVYPILSELVRGETSTVSKPYYNFFLHSFGLPLLLLMGIGPLVAWRRASLRALGRVFLWPLAVAVVAGAILLSLGAGSSRVGVIAYTFSVFVLASIVLEFVRGTRARKALGTETWAGAFSSLVGRNRRRYGGYVVHAAVVFLAIGVAGSSAYQTVREQRLAPGDSMTVAGKQLAFRGFQQRRAPNHVAIRAVVDVYDGGGHRIARMYPGKNEYFAEQEVSNEVAIRHDLLDASDLFLIADQVNPDGSVDLKVLQKPLVNLIWLAGFIFVGGALIALWPDAREERRLAERYAGALVEA
jgi:cytochrome c-type biogenesis protein CcmF